MNALDQFRKVQGALGMPEDRQDGIPGEETARFYSTMAQAALREHREGKVGAGGIIVPPENILRGAPGWSFSAEIAGDDIVIRNGSATWFGGVNDPLDNGQTSSGVDNRKPGVMGCALPVVGWHPSTHGSPLDFGVAKPKPSIPWFTQVEIEYQGNKVVVQLIDNGPAKSAGDPIDLSLAAFQAVAPRVPLKVGVLRGVNVRIIDGARYARKA